MSDETPPPLRLKPRVRAEPDVTAPNLAAPPSAPSQSVPPVPGATPTSAAGSEADSPRLRLKPKLANLTASAVEAPATPAQPVEPPAPPKIPLQPASQASTATAEPLIPPPAGTPPPAAIPNGIPTASEPPSITVPSPTPRLQPSEPSGNEVRPAKIRLTIASAGSESPKTAANDSTDDDTPEEEELGDSDDPKQPRPHVPHIRALADIGDDRSAYVAPKPASRPAKPLIGALAVLVIAAGGFLTFRALRKAPSPPPPEISKTAAPVAAAPKAAPAPAGPTPSATLNELAAAPARAIAKAQEAISAQQSTASDRIDAIVGTGVDAGQPKRPVPTSGPRPTDAVKTPPPVTATAQLAPGVSATTAARVAGDASPEFRAWVAEAKISGLFQGTPPRALINGRMVRGGQIVDEALQITFARVDSDTKMIVFTDPSGATVSRKF